MAVFNLYSLIQYCLIYFFNFIKNLDLYLYPISMKFSDKIGITKPKSVIQLNSMDDSLRNKLWNVLYLQLVNPIMDAEWHETLDTTFNNFFISLWNSHFELPIDTIPHYKEDACEILRRKFYKAAWYEVYNLIDFIYSNPCPIDKHVLKNTINKVLEIELAGYKYVGDELVPITEENEIKEIENVLNNASKYSFSGVKLHIESALNILSNKENPDYRNAIKESILAVESISQILTGDNKAELGKALTMLKGKIDIHAALEQGFKKIYGYTSDADGIRHALLEKDTLAIEDARYMLVSCSAFVNYLIVKAEKADLIK
jgi:hypothetical protein